MKKVAIETITLSDASHGASDGIRSGPTRRVEQSQQVSSLEMPNWTTLPTGLELLFSNECVKKFWAIEKPKTLIAQHVQDVLRRAGVVKNFESVELNIITEFHLYNLIFAKQTIFLDDHQAAVLMNIMWSLLINNNKEYGLLEDRLAQAAGRKGEASTSAGKKSIDSDSKWFQLWMGRHAIDEVKTNENVVRMKIFEKQQVAKIVEYARDMYFANFALYSHSLNNKNKNEEIQIRLYVDLPAVVPPLQQALYMGKCKIEIPEDDDDEKGEDEDDDIPTNSARNPADPDNPNGEEERELIESKLESLNTRPNSEEASIRKFVSGRMKKVEEEFNQTLEKRSADVNQQYDDILNPKKKK